MKLKQDPFDPSTVYADLGPAESLSTGTRWRTRAEAYARRVGAVHIEAYREDELVCVVNLDASGQAGEGLGDGDGAAGVGVDAVAATVAGGVDAE